VTAVLVVQLFGMGFPGSSGLTVSQTPKGEWVLRNVPAPSLIARHRQAANEFLPDEKEQFDIYVKKGRL
jgi:hypothetical protein